MQPVSTALTTRLASRRRRPGILLEIYAASYVPAAGAEFVPSAALERFSIKTINWLGQDYRREMRAIPTVKRNKGKEFSTMSLSFSNMDRYMAAFFLNNTVAGMWAVLRYVERDIQSTIADSLVLFVGRCEQPGDASQQTAALTVKQALGSVTQQVPWRTFDAVCPLVPVYHQEGEDCVGFNADGTPILLTEKPAAYQSHLTCGGSHSDCTERENLRFYQAFYFQPIGGSFQYTVREQRRFLFFFHRTRNVTATGQYSNADGTPYGTAVRVTLGRAQLEAVPIKFIDEGNELVTWAAWCEGLLAALQNVRNNTAGFTQPRFQADFLGDYGGNNGQLPVVHNGVTGEYYSRLAYSALVVSGSTPDVVDSPVTFSAVAVGAYPLPDEDGNFTDAGATSNPAYLTRFFLTDHHVMRHPTALVDDDETIATAAWCDRPLIDNTTGEAAPIPSSAVADGGARFRRYLSTGVLNPDYYLYRLGDPAPAPYEREIDYAAFEFPDDAPPDLIAPYVVLRRRYTANGVIAESVAAIDYLYDTLLTAFRGYLVTKRDGRIAIRSERPADVVYLQNEYDVDSTNLQVDDVEPWFNNLDGYLLLNPGEVTSEYHEVILAEYTGEGTSFDATSSGTLTATASSSKFLGGGPAVPHSVQATLSGTAEAGAQVYITAAGTASAAYTLTDGDTLETAAALLADTVNADPTVGRYVRAVWTVDDPTVVTFYLKWGILTLAEGLTNLQPAATEGIRIQYAFDASSITKDSFKWPGDQRQQYNQIKLKYREAKDDFAVTTLVYNDKANQIATGKTSTLNIDGGCIDNYHQAYRILLAARARYIDGNKVASWTTTRGTALLLEEGDVVAVTDTSNGLVNYPVTVETASLAAKLQLSFTARHYATALFVDEPPRAPIKIPSTLLGLPPTTTDLLLLNFPQLRTSDPALGTLNTVGVTVAASLPSGSTVWPTAELWIDRGNGYTKLADLPLESTIGRGVFVLPTATAQTWDNTHTITIDLDRPLATLPSGTMGNPVRILYGKEVIDYVTATQLSTSPNRWQLSGGLYRGAAGTDAHVGDHLVGDIFALVNEAVQYIPLETSDIATARNFKVIQKGAHPQTLDGVAVHNFTLTGEYTTPPDVAGVAVAIVNGQLVTTWTAISVAYDLQFRYYEVYDGNNGDVLLGRSTESKFIETTLPSGAGVNSYTVSRKVRAVFRTGRMSANLSVGTRTYDKFGAPALDYAVGQAQSVELAVVPTFAAGQDNTQVGTVIVEIRELDDALIDTKTLPQSGQYRIPLAAQYSNYPSIKFRARVNHILPIINVGSWSAYEQYDLMPLSPPDIGTGAFPEGARLVSDGVMAKWLPSSELNILDPAYGVSGSAATTTGSITSGTTLLQLDSLEDFKIGQYVTVAGASNDADYGNYLFAQIVDLVGINATLDVSATQSVLHGEVAHNDAPAIQALVTANGVKSRRCVVPLGHYNISGPCASAANSAVDFPDNPSSANLGAYTFLFEGEVVGETGDLGTNDDNAGVVFDYSRLYGVGQYPGAFSPKIYHDIDDESRFSFVCPAFKNIFFRTRENPSVCALQMHNAIDYYIDQCRFDVGGQAGGAAVPGAPAVCTHEFGVPMILPGTGNNIWIWVRDVSIQAGFWIGIVLSEAVILNNVSINRPAVAGLFANELTYGLCIAEGRLVFSHCPVMIDLTNASQYYLYVSGLSAETWVNGVSGPPPYDDEWWGTTGTDINVNSALQCVRVMAYKNTVATTGTTRSLQIAAAGTKVEAFDIRRTLKEQLFTNPLRAGTATGGDLFLDDNADPASVTSSAALQSLISGTNIQDTHLLANAVYDRSISDFVRQTASQPAYDFYQSINGDRWALARAAAGGAGHVTFTDQLYGDANGVHVNARLFASDSTLVSNLNAEKVGGQTLADLDARYAGAGSGVSSVFGRTGAVTAQANDYTWAQINKTTSSLADIATRSAGDLSSGTLLDARMPALTGDVTTAAGAVATAIGAGKVTNAMLAGSIAASKLIGIDITTLGTVATGTWQGTKIAEGYGGTNQTTYALGDMLYASAANTLSKLAGNITATKKYLSQMGNGSVSAAPSWAQVAAADISGLAASATTDATNAANITTGTLPNARLVAVPNSALANSSITIQGSAISLGGSALATNATPQFARLGLNQAADATASLAATQTALATTATDGFLLQNTTAATSGVALQYSPAIHLSGTAWDTGAVASKLQDWREYIIPTSGNPTSNKLSWASSIGGAAYAEKMSLTSAGTLTVTAFSGDGSALTALNATNLGSGTVPTARLGSGTANVNSVLLGNQTWSSGPTFSGVVSSTAANGFNLSHATQPFYVGNWTNTGGQGGMSFNENNVQQGAFQLNGSAFSDSTRQKWMEFVNVTSTGGISFWTQTTKRVAVTKDGSLVCSMGALATSATDGFLYVPTCAGNPSGTPTAQTGTAALVYDTTNNRLFVYNGGWKSVILS